MAGCDREAVKLFCSLYLGCSGLSDIARQMGSASAPTPATAPSPTPALTPAPAQAPAPAPTPASTQAWQ
eukprot:2288776-Pyramimonas_sp.AAC.1